MSLGEGDDQRLEELMAGLAREDTPARRAKFYQELLASSLRLATPALGWQGLPVGQEVVLKEDRELRFLATKDSQGRPAMLAFTSEQGLLAWRPAGCDTVELKVPELCAMALRAGMESVVINPQGPSGGVLTRAELEALAQGKAPELPRFGGKEEISPGSILIGRPAQAPAQPLIDALRQEAEARPGIQRISLIQAGIGGREPRLVIALDLAPGSDPDQMIPGFLEAVARRLGEGDIPDVLPLDAGSELQGLARQHGLAVFSREA